MDSTALDTPVDPRAGSSRGAPVSRARPAENGPSIDWSGRIDPDDGSDGDEGSGRTGSADGPTGRRRLAVVAGVVSAMYVTGLVADLVVLQMSATAYTTVHAALRSLGPRVVLAGVWLALLYHGLDGLRSVITDFAPRLRSRERTLRGAVAFLVFATWIPTTLVLLWPSIGRWFA